MIKIQLPVVSTPVAAPGISKGSDGALYTSSEDGSQYDSSMMTSKRTPEGFHSTPKHNHSDLEPFYTTTTRGIGCEYCFGRGTISITTNPRTDH